MAKPTNHGPENPPNDPKSRLGRDEWVMAALLALGDGGAAALRVEPLAKSLGVTKGSFYWHFADRQALHDAVLARWEQIATEQIIEQVEGSASTDPIQRLRALLQFVFLGDPTGDNIESAIRAWARTDGSVEAAAVRVDQRRLDYVSALLQAGGLPPKLADQRARTLYRALIGEFSWRTSGGPPITETELDDLTALLTVTTG